MSGLREWAYPMHDDDFETLERIMMSLPDIEVVWERLPAFAVAVADPTAAVYLRLAVESEPPTNDDGSSLLDPNEIWVADDERPECERLLVEACPSPAVWLAFACMMFASDEAHRAFGAAYTAATGRPHATV
jgi:hypothetical protein